VYAKTTKDTLPHLVIIVDEFAQLARELPEFLSELVKTVQVGRSLGLHLILGTQSPMDVITDEMNANLQFRICLRVQNVDASRAMLRRPDAAYLPVGRPGRGFLQVGERALFKQFQSAYSGAPYREAVNPRESQVLELVRPTGEIVNLLDAATLPDGEETITVAMAIADAITAFAKQKRYAAPRSLLLPSLANVVGLSALHAPLQGGCDGYRWLAARDVDGSAISVGSAPIGLVDDLNTRTQYPLWVHLNQNSAEHDTDGHLLVVGAPSTGKTTLLKTLALSLGALHSPDDLHLYFLSFTGNGLQVVSQLPHAAEMVNGVQGERVRRLFGRFMTALEERQSNPTKAHPHLILLVDQYEQFRDSYRDTHGTDLERLINEGRAVNIFVVLVLSTIHALPDRLRAVIPQRIAFQQSNSADYVLTVGRLGSTQQANLPTGRAYVNASTPLLAQIALPILNPTTPLTENSVNRALPSTVEALQDAYRRMHLGATANTIRWQAPLPLNELPTRLPFASLSTPNMDAITPVTPLGLRDDDRLSAFELDWWNDGVHFVVVGPPASGKTSLLHLATLSAAQQFPPSRLRFLLVDFNQRSLRPLETLKHVVVRVTDTADLKDHLVALNAELAATHALGEDAPTTVLVVDDYDLLADVLASDYDVLQQLRHLVRFYNDSPFHVWVAGYLERVGDPFIKQLLLRRSGFGLMHRDSLQRLNVRTSQLSADTMPVGRAFVPRIGGVDVVQLALIEDTQAVINYLNDDLWIDEDLAQWTFLPSENPRATYAPTPYTDTAEIDTQGLIDDLLSDLRGGGE
jgi:S-DNA-T family DNA segregation ATPase FtsK/SpoIIIE